jgi:hypothetical protein
VLLLLVPGVLMGASTSDAPVIIPVIPIMGAGQ